MLAEGFLCVCVRDTCLLLVGGVHVAEAVLEGSGCGERAAGEFAEEGAVACFDGGGHFDVFFFFSLGFCFRSLWGL